MASRQYSDGTSFNGSVASEGSLGTEHSVIRQVGICAVPRGSLWDIAASYATSWKALATAFDVPRLLRHLQELSLQGHAIATTLATMCERPASNPQVALYRVLYEGHLEITAKRYNDRSSPAWKELPAEMADVVSSALQFAAAITVSAALHVTLDTLLDLLAPFEQYRQFWMSRSTRYFTELTEQVPDRIWQYVRHWMGAAKTQAIWTPRDKLRAIEAIMSPLLTSLGATKRAMLGLRHSVTTSAILYATSDAVKVLTSVLAPEMKAEQNPQPNADAMTQVFEVLHVEGEGKAITSTTLRNLCEGVASSTFAVKSRGFLHRNWAVISTAACVAAFGIYKYNTNKSEITMWIDSVKASATEFYVDHVRDPALGIWEEVAYPERSRVANQKALQDATQSLQNMLKDFTSTVTDPAFAVTSEQAERMVQTMDSSFVSRIYEHQVQAPVRNAIAGDLVQLMLIQIQFIKREVLQAMESIDVLLQENEFNLRIMATVPAFLAGFGVVKLAQAAYRRMVMPTSTREIRHSLRITVRDIHRLLVLSSGQVMVPSRRGTHVFQQHVLQAGLPFAGLSHDQLGMLLLLLTRMDMNLQLLRGTGYNLSHMEWTSVQEDIQDLANEDLQLWQRLYVLQRMYFTHKFLGNPGTPTSLPTL